MKCEICHKENAETAITVEKNGADEELYVCKECAKRVKTNLQNKSLRTRKISGMPPGVSMSVTEIGGDGTNPPPFIEAIMNAFSGLVSDIANGAEKKEEVKERKFPSSMIPSRTRILGRIQLEALYVIGELSQVENALKALDMSISGIDIDHMKDPGHIYDINYKCSLERAKRVVAVLATQERRARTHLVESCPRLFSDTVCRSLAVLKNCRLLSQGEKIDMLSPLRIAAATGVLEGISVADIDKMISDAHSESLRMDISDDEFSQREMDCADEMNKRFEDVVLDY